MEVNINWDSTSSGCQKTNISRVGFRLSRSIIILPITQRRKCSRRRALGTTVLGDKPAYSQSRCGRSAGGENQTESKILRSNILLKRGHLSCDPFNNDVLTASPS